MLSWTCPTTPEPLSLLSPNPSLHHHVPRHCSWAKETTREGWPALCIHWLGENTCHRHPHKTKPFWENKWPCCSSLPAAQETQAGYCSCSCPRQRPPWEYIVPTCVGFPSHSYQLSHYVNVQLDMEISISFVYFFCFSLYSQWQCSGNSNTDLVFLFCQCPHWF